MRILIASVQVPFVRGGAEILAEGLRAALQAEGHQADLVTLPFKWYPPERVLDHMLACRLLDLTESMGTRVDRLVCLKFPAYLIPHPNKVVWLLHQHRTAYDLWTHPQSELIRSPFALQIRDAVHRADRQHLPQARAIFTIAGNVSQRLFSYNGIESKPLYHPPGGADHFFCADAEDYLFFPSRLVQLKRQNLVLQALAHTRSPVRVRFAGRADSAEYWQELQGLTDRLGLHERVEWLGHVTEEQQRQLYAHCLGVVFPPVDEDYGYVTLEAMLSAKPVLTCPDAGGPLEFVRHNQTGLVADPTPAALAAAMDQLWDDRRRARDLGEAGRARYDSLDISWPKVVRRLVA
jgi:glycosyltransferase involved in cell wall biosynthesis